MKILIVDDDLYSRLLLKEYLAEYGSCDMAVDGEEAVRAVEIAIESGKPYDLIFLDIMMPKMNGQEALKRIRQIEHERGIEGLDCVKIIMSTALDDSKNIIEAFKSQCEGYITKPYSRSNIFDTLKSLDISKL